MGTPLSIAMCSNRPQKLANAAWLLDCTAVGDEVLLVVDLAPGPAETNVLTGLASRGVRVLSNGANRGLSHSRNQALARCAHRHLVYVDDDIVVGRETVEAIRTAVSAGAGIVGVWLEPTFIGPPSWWLSGGQYHYLGVHHTVEQAKTWGACMAVDTKLAQQIGLTFRNDLGRRGNSLRSGEDTAFLADLRAAGASERFLRDSVAAHQVPPERSRLRYLLRRSWWQGRSEVCRSTALSSLRKEWRRAVAPGPAAASVGRRYLLSLLYTGAVLSGIVTEGAIRAIRRGRGRLPGSS
jgi:Glycosyl transferase family 2